MIRVNDFRQDGLTTRKNNRSYIENRSFNISWGDEPMMENVFDYLVADLLSMMEDKPGDYLSIGFTPGRKDEITCIQSVKNGDLYLIEIVVKADTDRGIKILSLKDQLLEQIIDYFWLVCVKWQSPDLAEWEDVTESVEYLE